jgi:hypothetical protein
MRLHTLLQRLRTYLQKSQTRARIIIRTGECKGVKIVTMADRDLILLCPQSILVEKVSDNGFKAHVNMKSMCIFFK